MQIWHTTVQAAGYTSRHPQTVRKAAEAGELHGTQRRPGGHWRFHILCLDAWVMGESCNHQTTAARRVS
ncbi:helix-turn-helix domain-containing protein [Nocardioides sp. TRM66260-LWL]|uniref:helix-turn-helix domain-containing protein n=1 Tax=Nocardioides sp. TRM66260-LWL TaxID=2874478 RepID=UPI001CC42B47|nr:helix-turn-helix domain-containing protein [Nocardioides sp. TRM66260-LWL]MBZ5735029.1 helix-turn-helix domain-containing protein [Nocardioides sp. TRM66260-LWL]